MRLFHMDGNVSIATSAAFVVDGLAPCTGVSFTTDVASPQVVGTTVTATASHTGCAAAEFKWWILPPGGSAFTLARDWGTNTFNWNTTALAAGDYRIAAYVRAFGSTSEAEAYVSNWFTLTP